MQAGRLRYERVAVSPSRADVVAGAELCHGYTLADIDRLALNAVRWGHWHYGMNFHDRREVAWSAIAECLCSSDEAPRRFELIAAAQRAIGEHVRTDCITHGVASERGYAGMPHFQAYWHLPSCHAQGPEERVVDRVALAQIWVMLSLQHRQVLLALAAYEDHGRAARSLGLKQSTYRNRMSEARRAFYVLWHEGERPSRIWARDYRGGRGVNPESRGTGLIQRRKREQRR
jgi:hypothetical protein